MWNGTDDHVWCEKTLNETQDSDLWLSILEERRLDINARLTEWRRSVRLSKERKLESIDLIKTKKIEYY